MRKVGRILYASFYETKGLSPLFYLRCCQLLCIAFPCVAMIWLTLDGNNCFHYNIWSAIMRIGHIINRAGYLAGFC